MGLKGTQLALAFVVRQGPPFNYDTNAASDESGLKCEDASLTRQSEAESADINVIVKRFGLTGHLPEGVRVPSYGDFDGVSDFHQAMELVVKAEEAFMQMPAEVRARFHNEPGEFVDFVSDDKNREEAVKLGIVAPPAPLVEVKPQPVVVVNGAGLPVGVAPVQVETK